MASPSPPDDPKPSHITKPKWIKNASKMFSKSRSNSASPRLDNPSLPSAEILSPSPAPSTNSRQPDSQLPISSLLPVESPISLGGSSRFALRTLHQSVGLFPPLQAAIDALISTANALSDAEQNLHNQTTEDKRNEIRRMAEVLHRYTLENSSEEYTSSIHKLLQSMEAQARRIEAHTRRGRVRRALASREDEIRLEEHQREVETLFRQLVEKIAFQSPKDRDAQRLTNLLQTMAPVEDASYNSNYSTSIKRRSCTPGTREGVQHDLQTWALDPTTTNLYWINGMAGTGKTTIAYSLCEWLEANKLLGASFFCSRGSPLCQTIQSIVPTIAYQMAQYSLPFRAALCSVIEETPNIAGLRVVRQFDKLICEPARAINDAIPHGVVVVIDALDACGDSYGLSLFLDALLQSMADLPFKFIVTSRPDPTIGDKITSPNTPAISPSILHLHKIEPSLVEADIKIYLTEALGNISPSPSSEQIEQLTQKAGSLFIFAAVVAQYICPGNMQVDSGARLRSLLEAGPRNHKSRSSGCYRDLDQFYTSILATIFDDNLEEAEIRNRELVLKTAACAQVPISVSALASLIGLLEQETMASIRPLESVMYLSDQEKRIYFLHASFLDYLLDPQRSGNFHVDEVKHNGFLADRCFQVMKQELCFNICRLHSSFAFDREISNMSERITRFISPALSYSCQHWGDHLQRTAITRELYDHLDAFVSQKLLFWMEVMNIEGHIGQGAAALLCVSNWLTIANTFAGTCKQIADAWDFVTRFAASPSSRSTPHIYLSALPFVPKGSSVYSNYWSRTYGLVNVSGTAVDYHQRDHMATWTTDSIVNSLVFSHDGDWIASGSKDGSLSIRNAYTGAIVTGPLKTQKGSVTSIAISPDCARVASGSSDCTIIIWSLGVGGVVSGPFEGHTYAITSIAFSPDGQWIASGSIDRTLRVWSTHTSDSTCKTFRGHARPVNSVAFSPDGTRVASGSSDCTVRVWDAHTGDIIAGPFKEHGGSVNSIAFSPDGASVASGSSDFTVRVWDINSGTIVVGPLQGHTNWVSSIAFSPDGAYITSGSYDSTIRKWDLRTGLATSLFKGHTRPVTSVAFSPDSTRIISGSYDHTIQLRNANTTTPLPEMHKFNGHTQCITSVACSPDNASIVSSSHDLTIRRWDMHTGALLAGPFKGHERPVTSVAFSPSGSQVASGSMDCSVRVWDTVTGVPTIEPLLGHAAWVNSVAFAPDGVRLISGSHDRSIKIWDTHAGCTIFTLPNAHSMPISSVTFSPDGARIASGSHDGTVQVWDAQTGVSVTGPLGDHLGPITSVAYSPDGTLVASTSAHSAVRVWDVCAGNEVSMSCNGNEISVNSVTFSRSGSSIVSGWDDSTTRASDTRSGLVVSQRFQWHGLPVTSVATSPDGSYTITGYGDRTSPDTQIRVSSFCRHEESNNNFDGHWALDPDGWVTLNNNVLFWSPHPIRQYLPLPYDSLVITQDGILQANYLGLTLGERWANCYNPVHAPHEP